MDFSEDLQQQNNTRGIAEKVFDTFEIASKNRLDLQKNLAEKKGKNYFYVELEAIIYDSTRQLIPYFDISESNFEKVKKEIIRKYSFVKNAEWTYRWYNAEIPSDISFKWAAIKIFF